MIFVRRDDLVCISSLFEIYDMSDQIIDCNSFFIYKPYILLDISAFSKPDIPKG